MISLLLATAAAAQLELCTKAVHGELVSAETVCALPKEAASVELWDDKGAPAKETISEACRAALTAGVQAGKYGSRLPSPVREGYVREYDKKSAACLTPPISKPIPEIKTTNLWD